MDVFNELARFCVAVRQHQEDLIDLYESSPDWCSVTYIEVLDREGSVFRKAAREWEYRTDWIDPKRVDVPLASSP